LSGVEPPDGTSAGIHGENFHPNELDVDPLAERLALKQRGRDDEGRDTREPTAGERPAADQGSFR
jgi:hypothetical protein